MEGGAVKAIVIRENGGPEKLVLEEIEEPVPGNDELLVEVIAAGVNFIDTYHRGGLYPMPFPFTPGLEGSGTVIGVGKGVSGFALGDRVGWTTALGSYAEKHVVPADKAVVIPDGVDIAVVAAGLLQGITAHYLARETFELKDGDKCLIHAGAGGVGLLLTQIAKMSGAKVVTTVGTDEKAALSRRAGADHTVVYTREDFKTSIIDLFGERSLDVVYDGVGRDTFMDGLELLRPRGMMVSFGNASGPPPEISPLILSQKGSLFLTRPTISDYIASRRELLARTEDLFAWIATGELEVRIGAQFALADAAEAHRALESRKTTGKVLLKP